MELEVSAAFTSKEQSVTLYYTPGNGSVTAEHDRHPARQVEFSMRCRGSLPACEGHSGGGRLPRGVEGKSVAKCLHRPRRASPRS